jgi:hypothetical protein
MDKDKAKAQKNTHQHQKTTYQRRQRGPRWDGIFERIYSAPHIARLKRWGISMGPESFLALADKRGWKPSTRATYYAAVLKNVRRKREVTPRERHLNRFFEQQKTTSPQTARQAMTARQAKALWRDESGPSRTSPARAAILFSWLYGQRISDTIQIQREYVTPQTLQQTKYWVLTLVKGKTIASTGPVSNHITRSHPLGKWITHQMKAKQTGPLFNVVSKEVNEVLAEVNITDRRAIRRGGLQDMARRGVPLEEIRRVFSRHQSIKTLNIYLMHGAMAAQDAQIQAQVAARTQL